MKEIDDVSEQAANMEKICLELDDYTKYLGKQTRRRRQFDTLTDLTDPFCFILEDKLKSANRAKT